MITTESLQKAAEKLYKNIEVEFIEDTQRSYWAITSLDPEECDENVTVAKLYDDYTFEIVFIAETLEYNLYEFEDVEELEEDSERLLSFIIDIIHEEIKDRISYLEILNDNLL